MVAYMDHQWSGKSTIYYHHVDCEQLVDYSCKLRCASCTKHRKSLSANASQPHKDRGTDHSSHITYSTLHTPEREEHL